MTTTSPPTSSLQQGAYVPSVDPQGMAAFAQETETSPTIASDYLPSNGGWSGLDGSGGSLAWLTGPWKGSGYTLSLGVPMFPTGVGASLATGATGAYNSYFTTLAQTLVAAGQANAYLRLGWEFDGSWTAWYAGTLERRGQLRHVLPADRHGHAVRFGRALPLRVESRCRRLHGVGLLGRRGLPRERLRGRHRPRYLRPVLGHAADAHQRLVFDRPAVPHRGPRSSPRRRASRSPSPNGA